MHIFRKLLVLGSIRSKYPTFNKFLPEKRKGEKIWLVLQFLKISCPWLKQYDKLIYIHLLTIAKNKQPILNGRLNLNKLVNKLDWPKICGHPL